MKNNIVVLNVVLLVLALISLLFCFLAIDNSNKIYSIIKQHQDEIDKIKGEFRYATTTPEVDLIVPKPRPEMIWGKPNGCGIREGYYPKGLTVGEHLKYPDGHEELILSESSEEKLTRELICARKEYENR